MSKKVIFDIWNSLPESFSRLKMDAFGILIILRSTYIFEQIFSSMKYVKC